MNQNSFDSPIDWQELDRLVDGQLTEFEYRELIAELELHPDGWRQCALAFLEHQALQTELAQIGDMGLFPQGENRLPKTPLDDPSESAVQVNLTPQEKKVVVEAQNKTVVNQFVAWTSIAISICVGVIFGSLLHSDFQDSLHAPTTVIPRPMSPSVNYSPAPHLREYPTAPRQMPFTNLVVNTRKTKPIKSTRRAMDPHFKKSLKKVGQ